MLQNGTCQIPDPYYKLVGSIICFYIPLGVMLITYWLTVQLLARQQQSLGVGDGCGTSGGGGGGSGCSSGGNANGWASGWLGQQPALGKSKSKHEHLVSFRLIKFCHFSVSLFQIDKQNLHRRRTSMYVASFTESKLAIDTESCTFSNINWYWIIKFRYTRTMAARLKVNIYAQQFYNIFDGKVSGCACFFFVFFFVNFFLSWWWEIRKKIKQYP